MNATDRAYGNLVKRLTDLDGRIALWREFMEKMLTDKAASIELTLSMAEKAVEGEDYLEKEKMEYSQNPIPSLLINPFGFRATLKAEPKNPTHGIREEMAIQICQGVLQELMIERKSVVSQLGVVMTAQESVQ